MKFISIIPARGGSKGIKRKNLVNLSGFPLVVHSIFQSREAKFISETYVSTDDPEIKRLSLKFGAKVIDRPKELARDDSSTESVLLHAMKWLEEDFDYFVLLQPTSPLRYSHQIDEAIQLILFEKSDSLLSVCKNHAFLWDKHAKSLNYDYRKRPMRQNKEWEFVENGSIYITKKKLLKEEKNRLGGKISLYIMPRWMSIEIDDEVDLEIVRYLFRTRYEKPHSYYYHHLKEIKLVIFDVDGVMTDGSVLVNSKGEEFLRFSRIDGKGIQLLHEAGFMTAVMTSEKLNIPFVFINVKDKTAQLEKLKQKLGLENEEICFLGDDIQDLDVMEKVAFSCCPRNAQQKIKDRASYVSPFKGGKGFVRDVCNLLLSHIIKK
ncbi:MAG: cytidylyltransferase domain-containing protein [Promethearchaeota archaeon]